MQENKEQYTTPAAAPPMSREAAQAKARAAAAAECAATIRLKIAQLENDTVARSSTSADQRSMAAQIAKAHDDEVALRKAVADTAAAAGLSNSHATKLNSALFVEAEIARRTFRATGSKASSGETVKGVPVRSKTEKEHQRRWIEKRHKKELEAARVKWLHDARVKWLEAARVRRPDAMLSDAIAAITYDDAAKAITTNELSEETRANLTDKEQKRALRERQERVAEEKKQRHEEHEAIVADMEPGERRVWEQTRRKLHDLQVRWHLATPPIDHNRRRADRLAACDQMVRFRSRWWHHQAQELYELGLPNEADGAEAGSRHPGGEKVYYVITMPPESFMEFAYDWDPKQDTQVFPESHAIRLLHAHEASARDLRLTALQRAERKGAEELLRQLVRDLDACDPTESFVFRLAIKCDAWHPLAKPDTPGGSMLLHGQSTCHKDEQDNIPRIVNLGPLRGPHQICGACDGYILVADDLIKSCDVCNGPYNLAVKAAKAKAEARDIRVLSRAPQEEEEEEKEEPVPLPDHIVFCCEPCKRAHIIVHHPNNIIAKKQAKRMREKRNKKAKARALLAKEKLRRDVAIARAHRKEDAHDLAMEEGPSHGFTVPDGFFDPSPSPQQQ